MSHWLYRYLIIIPVAYTEAANALAAVIDPGGQGGMTFHPNARVIGSESEEPTHCAVCTLATEEIRQMLSQNINAVQNNFWRLSRVDGELMETNHQGTQVLIGSTMLVSHLMELAGFEIYNVDPEV